MRSFIKGYRSSNYHYKTKEIVLLVMLGIAAQELGRVLGTTDWESSALVINNNNQPNK